MNLENLIVVALVVFALCLMMVGFSFFLKSAAAKLFYRSRNEKMREHLKALIPGSIPRETGDSRDPMLRIQVAGNPTPYELVYLPSFPDGDVISPHVLSVSINAPSPFTLAIQRRSFTPFSLYLQAMEQLGNWLGTRKDNKIYVGDSSFRIRFITRSSSPNIVKPLLEDPTFRRRLKEAVSGKVNRLVIQVNQVTAELSFASIRTAPKKADIEKIAFELFELATACSKDELSYRAA